jgi:hypothetical protein
MTPRARSINQGASRATWSKKRQWRARLWVDGRELSLGYHSTPEAARQAHAAAVKAHLGEAYLRSEAGCSSGRPTSTSIISKSESPA